MSDVEHLAVLGLSVGASPAEIKAAYRRLARDNHPDHNPDDGAAAERFRRAAEAYRALVDRDSGVPGIPHSDTVRSDKSARDVFDQVFGRARRVRKERGVDLRYVLTLAFLEAARGGEKLIRVPGLGACRRCGGTGAEPGSSPVLCPRCRGEGFLVHKKGFFDDRETCPDCRGRGRIQTSPCPPCGGEGEVPIEREIPIPIAPGVSTGTRLRVAGEGQPGTGGGEPGDLFVVIEVEPHPLFVRDGDDVLVEVPVPFSLAAEGGAVRVPTLDGVMRMRVPPGSQSGRVFRLKGKGLGGRGDQKVTLRVEVPLQLSDEARVALRAYARLEEEEALLPEVRAFEQALADLKKES